MKRKFEVTATVEVDDSKFTPYDRDDMDDTICHIVSNAIETYAKLGMKADYEYVYAKEMD